MDETHRSIRSRGLITGMLDKGYGTHEIANETGQSLAVINSVDRRTGGQPLNTYAAKMAVWRKQNQGAKLALQQSQLETIRWKAGYRLKNFTGYRTQEP